jgi:hypothetical protein
MKNTLESWVDRKDQITAAQYDKAERDYHKVKYNKVPFDEWVKTVTCGSGVFSVAEMSAFHEWLSDNKKSYLGKGGKDE